MSVGPREHHLQSGPTTVADRIPPPLVDAPRSRPRPHRRHPGSSGRPDKPDRPGTGVQAHRRRRRGDQPRPDHGCSSATRRCDPRSTSEANRRGSAPAPVSPTFPPLHCCCEPTPTGPSEGSTAISTWARTSTWSGAWQRPVTGSATNRPSSSSTRPVPACSDGSASGSSTGHRQRRWRPVIPGRWPPPVVRRGALLAGRSRCSDHGAWVHWWGWACWHRVRRFCLGDWRECRHSTHGGWLCTGISVRDVSSPEQCCEPGGRSAWSQPFQAHHCGAPPAERWPSSLRSRSAMRRSRPAGRARTPGLRWSQPSQPLPSPMTWRTAPACGGDVWDPARCVLCCRGSSGQPTASELRPFAGSA